MELDKYELNRKLNLPISFNLYGSTIDVVFDNVLMNNKDRYGESSYTELTIRLSNICGIDKMPSDRIYDCFYHEKVHMILNSMHEHELSANEKFVDTFAKLLRQSDITSIY